MLGGPAMSIITARFGCSSRACERIFDPTRLPSAIKSSGWTSWSNRIASSSPLAGITKCSFPRKRVERIVRRSETLSAIRILAIIITNHRTRQLVWLRRNLIREMQLQLGGWDLSKVVDFPQLSFSATAEDLVFVWSTNAAGFKLQTTTNLSG